LIPEKEVNKLRIEAYFRNTKEALDAASNLKRSGYNHNYIDMNEHYVYNIDPGTNLAGTETGQSLSNLTLGSGDVVIGDRTKAPLMAASPMASGMGGFEETASIRCKLIVDTGNNSEETAKSIILNSGGSIDNPYTNVARSIKDINAEKLKLHNERIEGNHLEDI
jgi:hypothetical protein